MTTTENQLPQPRSNKKVLIWVIVGVVAAVLGAVIASSLISSFTAGPSKEEAIEQAVAQIKEQTPLPYTVDEVTTMVDVTAEDTAIHYFYEIAGADPTLVTEDALRDGVGPQLCSTAETREFLDEDLQMKYSYEVTETGDTYDLAFSKDDC